MDGFARRLTHNRFARDLSGSLATLGVVRVLGLLVGLGMVASLAWCFLWGAISYETDRTPDSVTEQFHKAPRHVAYPSDGPFGRFDNAQLQRGFQVFSEVCSACHSLQLVHFRDLAALGYSPAEIKAIAAGWKNEVPAVNPDTGEPTTRKALPTDPVQGPFPNEVSARAANNGALPPDLSLITKAREGGAPYVYSILTGYQDPPASLPADARPGPNLHYNPYFANLNIAMPPPLASDGQVTYADGTKATVDQMAHDVSAFLVWTAEPKLENRRAAGIPIVLFLLVGTILAYLGYRQVWAEAKKRQVAATGPLDPGNMVKRRTASRKAGIRE